MLSWVTTAPSSQLQATDTLASSFTAIAYIYSLILSLVSAPLSYPSSSTCVHKDVTFMPKLRIPSLPTPLSSSILGLQPKLTCSSVQVRLHQHPTILTKASLALSTSTRLHPPPLLRLRITLPNLPLFPLPFKPTSPNLPSNYHLLIHSHSIMSSLLLHCHTLSLAPKAALPPLLLLAGHFSPA